MNRGNKSNQQPSYIADHFSSLGQVITSLREAGLESSNLILGIDFTKSNEWTGRYSFNRKSLHAIGKRQNPYEQAISIIGRTLSPFDEDDLIPCFGFGDATTRDQYVFSFYPENKSCQGLENAVKRYREIVPHLKLSDGQVTRNPDVPLGRLSPQEEATMNSIMAASHYPLSIVLVGVGDGPWDTMKQFDDNIPHREFDNFQFVNFTKIMSEHKDAAKKEAAFALAALMEIPFQYKATLSLNRKPERRSYLPHNPLPPPPEVIERDNAIRSVPHPMTETAEKSDRTAHATAPVCPICLTNPKDMAFSCGHTTCKECGVIVTTCPMCRQPITTRIRLYT
ncbi:PREDICTED: E3 ubiquitin-protein ligase RGLG1-like isoform X2 [Camelina sativa]|uniref:E3 ubiquitin-protein ligase RGLG1-like isoform X2 n=1 Tax=Camelina sativa TaxID=90675 RepID=A0ABM1QP02_CAMSA|nr:PREDICTED: E3 ubiquitin-protein ligase RGLG1-like isoform X2 [Camelina sativa]